MLKYLLIIPMFIRLVRWLAIAQQKEYRLDRLWLFVQSPEGKKEVWKLFFAKSDLTRSGLKRPVRTKRVLFTGFITVLLLIVFFSLCIGVLSVLFLQPNIIELGMLSSVPPTDLLLFSLVTVSILIGMYILVPFFVLLAIVPTAFIKYVAIYKELTAAQKKLSQQEPTIIGITGSYGKTTTKLLLAHVLSQKFSVFTTPKSFNTRYSIPKSINSGYTNQEIVVLEYAAYTKGEIKFLTKWFKPAIAVITGLTPQHLGLFGTMQNIIIAKSELIKALPQEAPTFCNARDEGAVQICEAGGLSIKNAKGTRSLISYSGETSIVAITEQGYSDNGTLYFVWNGKKIQTSLVGSHYLDAISAAIAIGSYQGLSEEEIIEGLKTFEQPSSFITLQKGKKGQLIIADGKTSNPKGFFAALELLGWYKQKGYRTILLTKGIVDLGNLTEEVHEQLASRSKQIADEVVYLGEDGIHQFRAQYGVSLLTEKEQIIPFIQKQSDTDAILIEGNIPKWLEDML